MTNKMLPLRTLKPLKKKLISCPWCLNNKSVLVSMGDYFSIPTCECCYECFLKRSRRWLLLQHHTKYKCIFCKNEKETNKLFLYSACDDCGVKVIDQVLEFLETENG